MALSFSVFNKFKAIDGITAPIRKMTKSVGKFGKTTIAAFRKSDRQASKFSKTLKGILVGGGILAGVALLQQGISSVTSEFVQFDDAIVAAGARFKDIGPDVKDFTASIVDIKKAARDAGATTEFTATQSAKALDFLARAGFSSAESIGSLNSMINLATSSGEEFVEVADMSSDLLGAFGLNADNTAQKIKNLNRLNDVLVKTVNSANVTVTDMFETMKQVGPVATGVLGASLEEVASLTAVLGSSGIKGSEAMTALKNAYLRLAAPTSGARKLMDKLKISIDDGKGGARKMTDIMEELGGKISGLSRIKQAEILNELFGKRAIAGGKNLIDNIKNIRIFEKSLLNASGTAQRTADVIRRSLGNRLKALNSAFQEFGFRILDSFKAKGQDAISSLTEALRKIDPKPIVESFKNWIKVHIKFVKSLKPVINFLKPMLKFIKELAVINKDIIPSFIILAETIIGLKIAVMGLNAVIAITNFLVAANPLTILITVIAGVIITVIQLTKHWDAMKLTIINTFSKLSGSVKAFLSVLVFLNPFTPILAGGVLVVEIFKKIKNQWEDIKNVFELGVILIKNVFDVLINKISDVFAKMSPLKKVILGILVFANPFLAIITGGIFLINIIGKIIDNWDKIKTSFQVGLSFAKDLLNNFAETIKNAFNGAVQFVGNIFSGLGNLMINALGDKFPVIKELFISFVDSIKEMFSGLSDFIKNIFSNIGNIVGDKLKIIGAKIKGIFNFGDKVKNSLSDFKTGAKGLFESGPTDDLENQLNITPKMNVPEQQQTNDTQISPNAGIINTLRQETENRSTVDVNFNNLPKGSEVEQKGKTNGFNLKMGFSAA